MPGNNLQLKALEKLVNQALVLDPAAREQLQLLAGKSVHIECTEPILHVVIGITDNGILLDPYEQQIVSSHLTGDLSAFTELLGAQDKVATLINGNLRLQGDSQLLMNVQKILQGIELDWEFHLAKIIGDLPAHWLGKLSRDSIAWLRSTQPVFMRHLQEFILEEAQLSPTRMEIEQFIDAIQSLVEKTERIEARLGRIKLHPRFHKDNP